MKRVYAFRFNTIQNIIYWSNWLILLKFHSIKVFRCGFLFFFSLSRLLCVSGVVLINNNIYFVNCADIFSIFSTISRYIPWVLCSVHLLFRPKRIKTKKKQAKKPNWTVNCLSFRAMPVFYWQVKFFFHFFTLDSWMNYYLCFECTSAQHPKKVDDWNKKKRPKTTATTKYKTKTIFFDNISNKTWSRKSKVKKKKENLVCSTWRNEQFYRQCRMDLLLKLWLIRLDIDRITLSGVVLWHKIYPVFLFLQLLLLCVNSVCCCCCCWIRF